MITIAQGAMELGWGDYGLAGLVIAGLIFLLFKQNTSHREERKEWRGDMDQNAQRHSDERKEWAGKAERQTDNLNRALNSLEKAIERSAREKE